MLILGIETTCDETAAAVVQDGRHVLSSIIATQIDLHAKFGGVVPEIASRAHLETLHPIIAEALARAGVTDPARQLSAIAVAHAPGLIGCLLIGVSAAKALAFAWGKPLVAVNHVQAHLYSVLLEPTGQGVEGAENGSGVTKYGSVGAGGTPILPHSDTPTLGPLHPSTPPFPALGLVISGGHTSLYHVHAFDRLMRIGLTHDDAVGEAFDKVAAILQLGYPGGPLIDRLARQGNENAIPFPITMLEKDSLDFSFSGIKTAVLYHVNGKKGRERDATALSPQQRADVAASFQRVAATMLIEKIRRAAGRYETRSLIVGGGVSANSAIRSRLQSLARDLGVPLFIPPLTFCTDNAAMTAGLGYPLLLAGKTAGLELEAVATV